MKYGLIGFPLSHSFSPELHALLGNRDYALCPKKESELASFFASRDFLGINVTIPYKQTVLPFLDGLSAEAEETGAVNTVLNRDGKLIGYNTDYFALLDLVSHAGLSLTGKRVLILGTGGTSRTALAVCRALHAEEALRVSRTGRENALTYDEAKRYPAEILINTTPCGMFPRSFDTPVTLDGFPTVTGVLDVIYRPLRTSLVLSAKEKGIPAEGGLYMLVSQAVRSHALFFDTPYDPEQTKRVYQTVLSKKENIVLIGLPGAGKTSVGERLARKLSRPFFDTDRLIGDVPSLLQTEGEEAFRRKETEVLRFLANETGAVIATGGGAVLRDENVALLQKNGRLLFLDRPVNDLLPTADRPLSDTREKLNALAEARLPRYRAVCDGIIPASGDLNAVTQSVLIKEGLV